ncbi:putative NADPH-quinone reductase [Paenibacillus favisporus]|uniref:NADPH-quinone reductase n=1 Tax=Paenibacillus favisporus TaxID=221028 RepID=A0ABV2EZB8_9BACL
MKVLVLIAHPKLGSSRINRRWKEELERTQEITVHDLYKEYPNENIDIKH